MVAAKGLRIITAALLIAAAAMPLTAEGTLSMELGINNLLLQTRGTSSGDKYIGWMTTGSGAFSFKSEGSKNVKADLAFSFSAPELDLGAAAGGPAGELMMPVLSLDRAYVKTRFPWFRVTAGKTRVGWGDGFVFNSGDVIFGSTDTAVDLTAAEIRTDTQWLAAVNIPLGRFSFIECVMLPPETDAAAGYSIGRIDKMSGGVRVYSKLVDIKMEAGYFFDQTGEEAPAAGTTSAGDWSAARHKPYAALQGNLFADWYLASSVALPVAGSVSDADFQTAAEDSFNISGGLFYLHQLNSVSSLTFRLEGLYRPFMSWEEINRSSADSGAADSGAADSGAADSGSAADNLPVYALLLYPELGWTPADTVNLSARAIWSPVDKSAMITAGGGWNIFEGFDLSAFAVFNAGDPDDSFAWDKDDELWLAGTDMVDGFAVVVGINYIY